MFPTYTRCTTIEKYTGLMILILIPAHVDNNSPDPLNVFVSKPFPGYPGLGDIVVHVHGGGEGHALSFYGVVAGQGGALQEYREFVFSSILSFFFKFRTVLGLFFFPREARLTVIINLMKDVLNISHDPT